MTPEEVIALAREAGLYVGTNLSGITLVGAAKTNGVLVHIAVEDLQRFAALVRQQDEALRAARNPHKMAEQISLMMTFADATITERQQDVLAAALKTILEPT